MFQKHLFKLNLTFTNYNSLIIIDLLGNHGHIRITRSVNFPNSQNKPTLKSISILLES